MFIDKPYGFAEAYWAVKKSHLLLPSANMHVRLRPSAKVEQKKRVKTSEVNDIGEKAETCK